jgi:hypothetical protein
MVKSTRFTLSKPRKPVVNFGWIGATTAFGYRFVDPIGVEFTCVISAALQDHCSKRIPTAALQTYFEVKRLAGYCLVSSNSGEIP